MRYNWTGKNVCSCIKTIEDAIEKEQDIEKKNYYMRVLDRTKSIVFANPLKFESNDVCRNNKMININDDFYSYGRYYELIDDVILDMNKMVDILWK